MAVIGMVLPGWPGHDWPATRLAAVLREAGHEVCAWTVEELSPTGDAELGIGPHAPRDAPAHLARATSHLTVELMGPLVNRLLESRVDVVVYDSVALWGRVAAEWLGLPAVASLTHYPPPVLGPLPAPTHVDDAVARNRESILESWGVDIGDVLEIRHNRAATTIVYTIPTILGMSVDDSWYLTGPLLRHRPGPEEPSPVRTDRPLVYMSMGTAFNRDIGLHRQAIDALGDLGAQVVVSTGRGLDPALLHPLPSGVEVARWVDPRPILAAASLFVTHGGASSIHEGLSAAVPLLVLPQGVDQVDWARRVCALGAGWALDEPDADSIREQAQRLLADDGARRSARALADELERHDGVSVAIAAIERALS
jgi:MGT family glycosyltransferase